MNEETTEMLTLPVTKDHEYNQYSCKAAHNRLKSNRSMQVQINPLFEAVVEESLHPEHPNSALYATVDKKTLKKNNIDDAVNAEKDVNIKDESQLPFTSFGKEESEKQGHEENVEGNANPSAETDEKSASSNLKQEGLIYIEVDFANKPGNTDTNVQPMIRGQEDPTEYTFADFSKQPPTEQDKPENVEQK
uniref:Uncharacterized protein LOC111113620 n=1 Tax=Crassostrea virginica TaxID=6565 RepID=A0A8B8BWF3_CRAVI|nr:uncharacterized protein LOC111113620 [Crassostrea virginica]